MKSGGFRINAVKDELLQAVEKHQLFLTTKEKHSNLQAALDILGSMKCAFNLIGSIQRGESVLSTHEGVLELKAAQVVKLVSTFTDEPIHKVYFEQASSAEVDTEGTFGWLVNGRFQAEMEGLVIAVQGGVILTNQ